MRLYGGEEMEIGCAKEHCAFLRVCVCVHVHGALACLSQRFMPLNAKAFVHGCQTLSFHKCLYRLLSGICSRPSTSKCHFWGRFHRIQFAGLFREAIPRCGGDIEYLPCSHVPRLNLPMF